VLEHPRHIALTGLLGGTDQPAFTAEAVGHATAAVGSASARQPVDGRAVPRA
jgi:hypothetical protein